MITTKLLEHLQPQRRIKHSIEKIDISKFYNRYNDIRLMSVDRLNQTLLEFVMNHFRISNITVTEILSIDIESAGAGNFDLIIKYK